MALGTVSVALLGVVLAAVLKSGATLTSAIVAAVRLDSLKP